MKITSFVMLNRFKRRPFLVLFFFIQFILFSTYTFTYYSNNNSNEVIIDVDPLTVSPIPDHLPASLIEKSNRVWLHKNYRNSRMQKFKDDNDSRTDENLRSLNISLVKDMDQQQTIVQCSVLPINLGNSIKLENTVNFTRFSFL
jgi:hypothetical protein